MNRSFELSFNFIFISCLCVFFISIFLFIRIVYIKKVHINAFALTLFCVYVCMLLFFSFYSRLHLFKLNSFGCIFAPSIGMISLHNNHFRVVLVALNELRTAMVNFATIPFLNHSLAHFLFNLDFFFIFFFSRFKSMLSCFFAYMSKVLFVCKATTYLQPVKLKKKGLDIRSP